MDKHHANVSTLRNHLLLFGKKIGANVRQQMKDTLRIQNEGGKEAYLRIPEDISGSKCKLYSFLKDK